MSNDVSGVMRKEYFVCSGCERRLRSWTLSVGAASSMPVLCVLEITEFSAHLGFTNCSVGLLAAPASVGCLTYWTKYIFIGNILFYCLCRNIFMNGELSVEPESNPSYVIICVILHKLHPPPFLSKLKSVGRMLSKSIPIRTVILWVFCH